MSAKISFQKITGGLAALSLVVVLASGCTSSYGTKVDSSKISQIKKGVTTRDELISLLGEPTSTMMYSEGKRMYMYSYYENHSSGSFMIPVVGLVAGSGQSHNQNLQVIINTNNVVEDFEFTDNTTTTTGGVLNTKSTVTPTEQK